MRSNIWPLLNKLYCWPREAWECFWQEKHEVEMRIQVWRPKTHKVSGSHCGWQGQELRSCTGFSTQVSSSRTTISAEAGNPCNFCLSLPSTNQARRSFHATLDRASFSRHCQTAQTDEQNGLIKTAETFLPSLPHKYLLQQPGEYHSPGAPHQP